MFTEKTVFILGAGASCHYGYPTGDSLVKLVKKRANWLSDWWTAPGHRTQLKDSPIFPEYFKALDQDPLQACDKFISECDEIIKRLEPLDPIVIDYFLHQNPKVQNIGKLIIAHVILEAEQQHKKSIFDSNVKISTHESNWCRFVIDKIISGFGPTFKPSEELNKNEVSFITFNYDVSLEYQLYRAIQSIEFFESKDQNLFFETQNLITHVYGGVRDSAFEDKRYGNFPDFFNNTSISYTQAVEALDKSWKAADTIKTIPEAKAQNETLIKEMRSKIKNAEQIFILGYGFDESNNALLELKRNLSGKKVYFTNLGNNNRINKRAGKLLWDYKEHRFYDSNVPMILTGAGQTFPYEKSNRDVYNALAIDFNL